MKVLGLQLESGAQPGWNDSRVQVAISGILLCFTIFGGSMLDSQKFVDSGPVQPVQWAGGGAYDLNG